MNLEETCEVCDRLIHSVIHLKHFHYGIVSTCEYFSHFDIPHTHLCRNHDNISMRCGYAQDEWRSCPLKGKAVEIGEDHIICTDCVRDIVKISQKGVLRMWEIGRAYVPDEYKTKYNSAFFPGIIKDIVWVIQMRDK